MKHKALLYHICAWALVIAYDLFNIWRNQPDETLRLKIMLFQFSFCLSMIAVFYYCYLFVYPRYLKKNKIPQLVVSLVFIPVVFSIVRCLLEQVLYPLLFGFANYYGHVNIPYYLYDNIYNGIPVTVISAAVWSAQEAFYKQKENEVLKKEKLEAELVFLKSQINPHFLYNTLNYIYSLAYPVSEELADAVIKLSQLMRYMLNESGPDGLVDIQKEIDYLNNYIDLYRLRFKDQFFVRFDIEGELAGKRIPSLVLIPLVENAFKHGEVNDPQRPVKISLKIIGATLLFTVSNKINHQQKDASSGIGLVNIRRRLELIYPGKHELLIGDNGQTYKASLNIKLQ